MIIVYAIVRRDIVFLIAGSLQLIIFTRSLMISKKITIMSKTHNHRRLLRNFEDKYTAKNPISKFLMGRFHHKRLNLCWSMLNLEEPLEQFVKSAVARQVA